jgi:hypothetical protein
MTGQKTPRNTDLPRVPGPWEFPLAGCVWFENRSGSRVLVRVFITCDSTPSCVTRRQVPELLVLWGRLFDIHHCSVDGVSNRVSVALINLSYALTSLTDGREFQ